MEDQEVGLKRMRAGEVAGCVCASPRPVTGGRCVPLGAMRYRGLASPAFVARHFPDGVRPSDLTRAPAIVFGPDDQLQHRYLADLGVSGGFIHHLCPSSEGFVRLTCGGLGWGLVPEQQVRGELARGELVELVPGQVIDVPLYWHHWRNGGELLAALTAHLLRNAAQMLVPIAG
ncbi:putative HTH-type transcriptional regulator [compost metagenome]